MTSESWFGGLNRRMSPGRVYTNVDGALNDKESDVVCLCRGLDLLPWETEISRVAVT